jgi:hypothetical protein
LSTESISRETVTTTQDGAATVCASCGVVMASDQRYCLECGVRRAGTPSFFLDTLIAREIAVADAAAELAAPPPPPTRSISAAVIISSIGVLLLAMAIGVIIGRSGSTKTPPAQVISVSNGAPASGAAAATGTGAAAPSTGSATSAGSGAGSSAGASSGTGAAASTGASSVTDSWPSGTAAFTVELQSLPTSTAPTIVISAQAAAREKGATAVGVLLSSNHPPLPAGQYIIYSGSYPTAGAATAALAHLKPTFPTAATIHVGSSGAAAKPPAAAPKSSAPPAGACGHGQSGEQCSKNEPNVVGT